MKWFHVIFSFSELAAGRIKDHRNGVTYTSNSPLSSNELLQIASEAKNVLYFDGTVNWVSAALEKAKAEKQDPKVIKQIK